MGIQLLTRHQFEVLNGCRKGSLDTEGLSQRDLAALAGLSLGTVNTTLASLRQCGYIASTNEITERGLQALSPYRVTNAIIMAAGLSSRFAPISFEKPKGVLVVKGEVLIERQIRQLQEAGIKDITVVVGYQKEQFFYLEEMFGVTIVINPDYGYRNNNSTIKRVEDRLDNTYICSSDDYFVQNPFEPYVYESYYAAEFIEGPTSEYCIHFKKKHREIYEVVVGGADEWVMLGHAYWDRSFSTAFCEILNDIYDDPATYGMLWEDIYLEHIDELPMVMRPYGPGIIWEFDSLDELHGFDEEFIDNVDSSIMDHICETLKCTRADIHDIEPIKQGLTNLSCRFTVDDKTYVFRHPGLKPDPLINRPSETLSEAVAKELGLDCTFIHEDPDQGWKISYFISDCTGFDYQDPSSVAKALAYIRKLHDSDVEIPYELSVPQAIDELLNSMEESSKTAFRDFDELRSFAHKAATVVASFGAPKTLCHNNFYDQNILVSPKSMNLIDWEYAAMGDYGHDLGTFICCSETYGYKEALWVWETYYGSPLKEDEISYALASVTLSSFFWFVWALYKESTGNPVGDGLYLWYKKTKEFGSHL